MNKSWGLLISSALVPTSITSHQPSPKPPFFGRQWADSSTTVERARGSGAHLAWTLCNGASACFLRLGAENCEMHLPVCCSLSTSAVMQNRAANNGEKTLIQKLITLLNKPAKRPWEWQCRTSVWKQPPSAQNHEKWCLYVRRTNIY